MHTCIHYSYTNIRNMVNIVFCRFDFLVISVSFIIQSFEVFSTSLNFLIPLRFIRYIHMCICMYVRVYVLCKYHMVGNFCGVQIFVDFMCFACPREITEF